MIMTQLQATRHLGRDGSEAAMHPVTHRLQGLEAIGRPRCVNADDFRVGVFHGDEDIGPAIPDKLWARLRFAGVRTSPRRVRRVMRENGLLAPHRVGRTETRPHDGTIITNRVNEMWGTDMAQTITPAPLRTCARHHSSC
jgi:hypothetical protein